MKKYEVNYVETIVYRFYVNADDEDHAREVFDEMCGNDEISFTDVHDVLDSEVYISEI